MGMPGNRNRRSESREGRHSRSPAWECRETETEDPSPVRDGTVGSPAWECRETETEDPNPVRDGTVGARHGNAGKPKLCSFGQRSNSSSARMIESRQGRHSREPGMGMPGTETEDPSPVRDGTVGARHGNAGKQKPKIRVP